jgi:hypothetical protein
MTAIHLGSFRNQCTVLTRSSITSTLTATKSVYPDGRNLESMSLPSIVTQFAALRVSRACDCFVNLRPITTRIRSLTVTSPPSHCELNRLFAFGNTYETHKLLLSQPSPFLVFISMISDEPVIDFDHDHNNQNHADWSLRDCNPIQRRLSPPKFSIHSWPERLYSRHSQPVRLLSGLQRRQW